MALGESQAWSCTARGCDRRSFLVRFSYSFKALLKTSWKLEDEDVAEGVRDMGARVNESVLRGRNWVRGVMYW